MQMKGEDITFTYRPMPKTSHDVKSWLKRTRAQHRCLRILLPQHLFPNYSNDVDKKNFMITSKRMVGLVCSSNRSSMERN